MNFGEYSVRSKPAPSGVLKTSFSTGGVQLYRWQRVGQMPVRVTATGRLFTEVTPVTWKPHG